MWKHPGTMMSPEMTTALRSKTLLPGIVDKLMKDTPLTWQPRPLEVVDIDWGGKGKGHEECTKDGEMAYRAALLSWVHKDDHMAQQYGNLAYKIINSWAQTNKTFKGNNAPLEAAWSVCSLARAAELIKYHHNNVIKKQWLQCEPVFFKWLDVVIMPVLRTQAIWKWPLMGNWHYSIICARMQIAILREDRKEWDWCIATYKDIFPKSLGTVTHHISETLRDCTHAMFLLGGMLQVPEMAYHQGVTSLYDSRLHGIVEYHARIMLGEVPHGISKEQIKTPYGLWPEPVWEIGFNHFTKRQKQPMPYTEKLLTSKVRPERVTFHWGGGTLTHL